MSARSDSSQLLQPIAAERPCGENLEDTELLSSFDAFRLFAQKQPLDAPADPDERRIPKPPDSPEWIEIRDKALDALAKSKDLRLLATLGTALLRTDGVKAFAETLSAASQWLDTYWRETYPLVDEDAILRRNALNCFADPMAVVEGLRRVPLVRSRQHGTYSLRDVDIATHQISPAGGEANLDEGQITAAFGATPLGELAELLEGVALATASLEKIDVTMREAAGYDAVPSFDALSKQLTRMSQVLRAQIASHPDSMGAPSLVEAPTTTDDGGSSVGVIKSRQDAIRVLDAVAAFFRRTEPSSPIPLFLERAKRLVSKDFLEVLADIAPEAVAQARAAGGLKQGE
jgi:type VI secretion system protein ImpA